MCGVLFFFSSPQYLNIFQEECLWNKTDLSVENGQVIIPGIKIQDVAEAPFVLAIELCAHYPAV